MIANNTIGKITKEVETREKQQKPLNGNKMFLLIEKKT